MKKLLSGLIAILILGTPAYADNYFVPPVGGGGGSGGTVTSVGLQGDGTIFNTSVLNSPIISTGILGPLVLRNQAAWTVLGNATSGSAAPTFVNCQLTAGTGLSINNSGNLLNSPTISLSTPVLPVNGGTGKTSAPSSNQVLVGNGSSGYDLLNLVAGANIVLNNSSGNLTITASGTGADPNAFYLTTVNNTSALPNSSVLNTANLAYTNVNNVWTNNQYQLLNLSPIADNMYQCGKSGNAWEYIYGYDLLLQNTGSMSPYANQVKTNVLTGGRICTLPDANSNPVQPLSSASGSNFVQYIDSAGVQHLATPSGGGSGLVFGGDGTAGVFSSASPPTQGPGVSQNYTTFTVVNTDPFQTQGGVVINAASTVEIDDALTATPQTGSGPAPAILVAGADKHFL